jgi:hypothetical protein
MDEVRGGFAFVGIAACHHDVDEYSLRRRMPNLRLEPGALPFGVGCTLFADTRSRASRSSFAH